LGEFGGITRVGFMELDCIHTQQRNVSIQGMGYARIFDRSALRCRGHGQQREQFGGRLVREQGSVTDGCWDSTSLLKPVSQVDGQSNKNNSGDWAIQSDNTYGDDSRLRQR
jgi:hypothetical protein